MFKNLQRPFATGIVVGVLGVLFIVFLICAITTPFDQKSQKSKNVEKCITNLKPSYGQDSQELRVRAIICDALYGTEKGTVIKEDTFN